jgi:hypothetical protein
MPDLSNARLARLERLSADRPSRWRVEHAKDGTEVYWIESPRGTICDVEEVEPGDWDADTRAEILGDLTDGTHRLRSDYQFEPWAVRARK